MFALLPVSFNFRQSYLQGHLHASSLTPRRACCCPLPFPDARRACTIAEILDLLLFFRKTNIAHLGVARFEFAVDRVFEALLLFKFLGKGLGLLIVERWLHLIRNKFQPLVLDGLGQRLFQAVQNHELFHLGHHERRNRTLRMHRLVGT